MGTNLRQHVFLFGNVNLVHNEKIRIDGVAARGFLAATLKL